MRSILGPACGSISLSNKAYYEQGCRQKGTPLDSIITHKGLRGVALRLFVNSSFWHKYWHSHRLPERSFSIERRQFHVCARCTGVAIGLLLIPIPLVVRSGLTPFWVAMLVVFLLDAVTQLASMRRSNNKLRFVTGLFAPSSVVGAVFSLIQGG